MNFFKKYPSIILIGLVCALVLVERYFYLANLFVHAVIDLFAGGRSLVKVELFLAYLVFLAVLVLVIPFFKFLQTVKVKNSWLLASVLASFAYNISLLFVFFSKWGFKARDFVVLFNNGEISSTMILHNHLMKGFNGTFLNWFGSASQENADTGFAFVGLLPTPLYLIGAVFVLISAVLLIGKFIELYNKQDKRRMVFLVTYAIVSFSLLKNMLDGGVFNRETPIALFGLLLIIYYQVKDWTGVYRESAHYYLSAIPLVGFILLILIFWGAGLINIGAVTTTLFSSLAFLVGITGLVLYQFGQSNRQKFATILLCLAVLMLAQPLYDSVFTYMNSRRLIETEGVIVGLYNEPKLVDGQDWELEDTIGNMSIYRVKPIASTRINEILLGNKLLGNLSPISLPGSNCNVLEDEPYQISFVLSTITPFENNGVEFKYARFVEVEKTSRKNNLYRYQVKVEFESCAPRILNILQELVRSNGHETFFLTNVSERYAPIN